VTLAYREADFGVRTQGYEVGELDYLVGQLPEDLVNLKLRALIDCSEILSDEIQKFGVHLVMK
jgi:hypothetical protein